MSNDTNWLIALKKELQDNKINNEKLFQQARENTLEFLENPEPLPLGKPYILPQPNEDTFELFANLNKLSKKELTKKLAKKKIYYFCKVFFYSNLIILTFWKSR